MRNEAPEIEGDVNMLQKPHIDEYGAMVEWSLPGETRATRNRSLKQNVDKYNFRFCNVKIGCDI
jgi:hypothetical protein